MPETTAAAAAAVSSAAATERDHQHRQQNEKGSPKLLSLLLKTLIMSLLTSLFFLFLGLAAIILLHLFLAGRHFHRRNQQSPPRPHASQHHHHHHSSDLSDSGYSRDDLRKLPRFRYGGGTVAKMMANYCCSNNECAVCLESFRDDQLCRSLPDCRHVFHLNCIDSWLVKVPACPLCRARVRLSSGGASSSGAGLEQAKHLWTAQSWNYALPPS